MAITTDTVALGLAQRLVAHGVAIDDVEAFAADFAPDLVDWVGGEEAVPVALASKVTTTAGAWNTDVMQRLDWWTGAADGGPNGDGLYPMTNAAGVTTLFPSLAKILDSTAKGNAGWSAKTVIEADGATRAVVRVLDWIGGEGAKPATGYIAADGSLVGTAAAAYDFFGGISATLTMLKDQTQVARDQATEAAALTKVYGGQSRFAVSDEAGNILINVTPAMIDHPDTNAMRVASVAGAAAGAAVKPVGGASKFVVSDEAGNILFEATPTTVNHPDINVMRAQVALSAVAAAAVKSQAGAGHFTVSDEAGNILLDVSPAKVNHPDVNTIRTTLATVVPQAAQGAAAAAMVQTVTGSSRFTVSDAAGNILFEATPTTVNHPDINAIRASVGGGAYVKTIAAGNRLLVADEAGNILIEITPKAVAHPQVNALQKGVDSLNARVARDYSDIYPLTQILHFLGYGQSLMAGDTNGGAVITTSLPAYAQSFSNRVRPWDGGTDPAVIYAALTAYAEHTVGRNSETPMAGCLQMIYQLLLAEDGIDLLTAGQTLLGSVPAQPGTTITQLSKGGSLFPRVQNDIAYGAIRAAGLGKSYAPAAMLWAQGEGDYSTNTAQSAYVAKLRQLRLDAEAEAQAASGLKRPLPLIMYQVATHIYYGRTTPSIALGQLEVASDDYACMATPTYFLPFDPANTVHLTQVGSKWLGAYFGLAAKRWLFDGKKPTPLVPKSWAVQGSVVTLVFPVAAGRKLVLDTATVADPGNYGFAVLDATGAALTVSGVELVGRDKVKITCASGAPATVNYAWAGDALAGRGNLRDNAGDALIFDPSGINKPMHAWAPIFSKGLT